MMTVTRNSQVAKSNPRRNITVAEIIGSLVLLNIALQATKRLFNSTVLDYVEHTMNHTG